MSKKILFLSPEAFSGTGGIQRMSRNMAYVLQQICKINSWNMNLYCLNDRSSHLDTRYLPFFCFKGFGKNKTIFTIWSVMNGMNADIVVLAHVNLSLPAMLIRLFNPKCKIWLVAHGTEVWRPLEGWKKSIFKAADRIICVSHFTKNSVIALQDARPRHCIVLNNALDPFIKLPAHFIKPDYLLARYGFNDTQKIVLTLTRMSPTEKFKGYDNVINAISKIKPDIKDIIYLLAGPCDATEKERIEKLITTHELSANVILTGLIEENELTDHFLLADLFVLPSTKEGFGIVFIEAMACGLPVICGNVDGSIDAVRHEGMGTAIDPHDADALELAIRQKLAYSLTTATKKTIQQECLKHFNGTHYTAVLNQLMNDEAID